MTKRRTFIKAASAASVLGLTGAAGCVGKLGEQPYVDGKLEFLLSPRSRKSR
ncbi:hypothetical protein [Haladaptatus salinisoli]|uniref:hypothetical protein n=1 Tax=Haladaptatus salinisoli TaxID=2884876 RepID=UPI001D0AE2CE|nr:hypothetical protein [Haladaptatus salinisoli]